MYAVSLLPSEYKSYQRILKRNDRLFFIALTMSLASAVLLITSVAISSIYDHELETVKSENISIAKEIDKLKPIELLQAQVSDLSEKIKQAAGLSPSWEELITGIGNSITPKIGLSSIKAQYQDQAGMLVINGNASSHNDVSRLMEALETQNGFGGIKCKISSEVAPGQSKDVQFELDIPLVNAAPYELPIGR